MRSRYTRRSASVSRCHWQYRNLTVELAVFVDSSPPRPVRCPTRNGDRRLPTNSAPCPPGNSKHSDSHAYNHFDVGLPVGFRDYTKLIIESRSDTNQLQGRVNVLEPTKGPCSTIEQRPQQQTWTRPNSYRPTRRHEASHITMPDLSSHWQICTQTHF